MGESLLENCDMSQTARLWKTEHRHHFSNWNVGASEGLEKCVSPEDLKAAKTAYTMV
jgi:hypothetical protein